MAKVYRDSKIYICALGNYCSGGPEALHQLSYYLNQKGYDSWIVYYSDNEKEFSTPEKYKQYKPKTCLISEIDQNMHNIVVVPESATYLLERFDNIQKVVWWLGLVAHDRRQPFILLLKSIYKCLLQKSIAPFLLQMHRFKYYLGNKLSKDDSIEHACGSKYAYETVSKKYKRVYYLVEPISKDFLELGPSNLTKNRKNAVAYNPAKKSITMKKLLKRAEFSFIPIKNMTPNQIANTFNTVKLYVDFGEFGGPERMPKEAVYNGCTILVADHNAASNDFDVAIPQKYKIKNYKNINMVSLKIKEMLENYENNIVDFIPFKQKIEGLEESFKQSIEEVFVVQEQV